MTVISNTCHDGICTECGFPANRTLKKHRANSRKRVRK